MRTTWIVGSLILLVAVGLFGCGPRAETVTPPDVTASELIRRPLQGIVESGAGGSEVGAILTELGAIREAHPELADALQADAEEMMGGGLSQEKIKAKAQEMIDKLDAAIPPTSGG